VLGFIAVFLIIAIALVIYFSTNTSSSSSGWRQIKSILKDETKGIVP
jgi:cell shape-determining protein MreC